MRRFISVFKRDKASKSSDDSSSPHSHYDLHTISRSSRLTGSDISPPSASSSDMSGPTVPRPLPSNQHLARPPSSLSVWLSRRRSHRKTKLSVVNAKEDAPPPVPQRKDDQARDFTIVIPTPTNPKSDLPKSNISSPSSIPSALDNDNDSMTEQSDDDDDNLDVDSDVLTLALHREHPPPSIPLSQAVTRRSIICLSEFTVASLAVVHLPHPLLRHSHLKLGKFPRSMTLHSQVVRYSPSLVATMHKNRLMARLNNPDSMTEAEKHSIAAFANKTCPPLPAPPLLPEAITRDWIVARHSTGLLEWTRRPCYEDRARLWVLDDSGYLYSRGISGTGTAVAALEYSEELENLAGLLSQGPDRHVVNSLSDDVNQAQGLASSASSNSSKIHFSPSNTTVKPSVSAKYPADGAPRPAASILRSGSGTTVSSLLRLQKPASLSLTHLESAMMDSPVTPSPSTYSDLITPTASTSTRRGVRFHAEVEEVDADDLIPLAVTLKEKRKHEVHERLMWEEKDRQRRQAEDKARLEERRRKQYADEVVAARKRREAHRTGFKPGPGVNSEDIILPAGPKAHSHGSDHEKRYSSSSTNSLSERGEPIRSRSPASSGSRSFSRPASYASSLDEAGLRTGSRASSSASISSMGRSSPVGSTDNLRRAYPYAPEFNSSRSRKSSDRARSSIPPTEPIPPVPFLARDWTTVGQDMLLPPQFLMQQGPFMASVRSQKQITQQRSRSSDRVDRSASPLGPRPEHPRRYSEHEAQGLRPVPSQPRLEFRTSFYGSQPSRSQQTDMARRGTVIF